MTQSDKKDSVGDPPKKSGRPHPPKPTSREPLESSSPSISLPDPKIPTPDPEERPDSPSQKRASLAERLRKLSTKTSAEAPKNPPPLDLSPPPFPLPSPPPLEDSAPSQSPPKATLLMHAIPAPPPSPESSEPNEEEHAPEFDEEPPPQLVEPQECEDEALLDPKAPVSPDAHDLDEEQLIPIEESPDDDDQGFDGDDKTQLVQIDDVETDFDGNDKTQLVQIDDVETDFDGDDKTQLVQIDDVETDFDGDDKTQLVQTDDVETDFDGDDKTQLVHIEDVDSTFDGDDKTQLVHIEDVDPTFDGDDKTQLVHIEDVDPTFDGDDKTQLVHIEDVEPIIDEDSSPSTPSPALAHSTTEAPSFFDDSDDDFHVEKTELYQSPFENDPIRPRLSTLEGPATGQEFLIGRMRSTIGRATTNSVAIPDLSMSRQHFEIFQRADESYAIKDLRSINGTSLNGTKIQEADLFHGDRIQAGESLFQFLIPGTMVLPDRKRHLIPAATTQTATAMPLANLGAPAGPGVQQRAGSSSADRLLLAVTIVAAVLSLFLILHLVQKTRETSPAEPEAQEFFFAGVAAIQNRDWDEAHTLFEKSYRLDPSFGDVPGQLTRIKEELRFLNILQDARAHAVQDLPSILREQLAEIPKRSVYFEDAQALLQLARNQEALDLFSNAQKAFDDGQFEDAQEALSRLRELSPHHEGAQTLQAALTEAASLKTPSPEQDQEVPPSEPTTSPQIKPEQTRQAAPPRTARRSSATTDGLHDPFAQPRQASPTTSRAPINFTEGFTLYRNERFDEAIAHFESIRANSSPAIGERARAAIDDIHQFRSARNTAQSALTTGNFRDARRALERAESADKNLAGGRGYFTSSIAELRAQSFALEGLQRLDNEAFSQAFELLVQAESFNPRERETRRLARALEERANGLYIRAVNQRKSDPKGAASLCRTILSMVPSSSQAHRKARQMLDELNN